VAAAIGRPSCAARARSRASIGTSAARRWRVASAYSRSPNASRSPPITAALACHAASSPSAIRLPSPPHSAISPRAWAASSSHPRSAVPLGARRRPAVISRVRLRQPS
jgi:hypothetical protein